MKNNHTNFNNAAKMAISVSITEDIKKKLVRGL